MDVIAILRLGYLGAAGLVVFIASVPRLRSRFLDYGARASASSNTTAAKAKAIPDAAFYDVWLDRLAAIRVPHSWFTSFYVVCVAWSLFWATQLLTRGPAFRAMASATAPRDGTMTFRQVTVAWAMLLIQGSRRLYESLEFARPSKSQMWFVHWLLGLAFYTATTIAIWIEGIPTIQNHTYTISDLALAAPTLRTFLSTLLFLLASGIQYDCHAYLASLKPLTSPTTTSPSQITNKDKSDPYTLPTHPFFTHLIAPHYTAECLIYLSLMLVAAPQGQWVNGTLACALVFVGVNLGVTAGGTRRWYEGRFGAEAVRGRWRVVPWVF